MTIQTSLQVLQIILTFGNICVLFFAFIKFIGKPHNTLETRVTVLENEIEDIKKSLRDGNEHFRELDNASEVILRSTLALIDFEIQYCLTEKRPVSEDLKRAHDDLNLYLTKR